MENSLPFILASGSPRRRELLSSLGVKFTINVPDIDEIQGANESPADCVRRLSRYKAQAVASDIDYPALILAADTVVVIPETETQEAVILNKPSDDDHARQMLLNLRGKAHEVYTGVTIMQTGSLPLQITRAILTQVFMRNLTDEELEAYVASGEPLDKAGGYAIQDQNFNPVERIEGSYSNVVGLPIEAVKEMLTDIGYLDQETNTL
jgi:septum formation protein